MKVTNRIITLYLSIFCFISCSTEDLGEENIVNSSVNKIVIEGEDFKGIDGSRTTLDIDFDTMNGSFQWVKDDTLGIFPVDSEGKQIGYQVAFPLTEIKDDDASKASFKGGGWALVDGAKYLSYYPFAYNNRDMCAIPISYKGQQQVGKDNMKHFGAFDYMFASGAAPASGEVNFKYKHLGHLLIAQITLHEDANLTELQFISPNKNAFIEEGTFNLGEAPNTNVNGVVVCPINPSNKSNTLSLKLQDKDNEGNDLEYISVKAGETIKLYLNTAPFKMQNEELKIKLLTTDKWYQWDKVDTYSYEAGKFTRFVRKTADAFSGEPGMTAYIGTKGYRSLSAALAESTDGDEIILTSGNHELSGATVKANNVTIKGENKTNVIVNLDNSIYLQDKSVTLKNLTYTVSTGKNYDEYNFAYVHHAKAFNLENCIIDRLRLNVSSSEITNCEFNITTSSSFDGYALFYYGKTDSRVKVSNSTFNTAGRAIVMYKEGPAIYDLTVENCVFNSSNSSTDKAAIQMHTECGISGKLTVNNSTATGFADVNGGLWNELDNNTKTPTNKFLKIIDGVYYIGTDDAFEQAVKMDGDINIVLTGDVNLNANDAYLKLGGETTQKISIKGQTPETRLTLSTNYWSRLNTVNPNAVISMENLTLTSSQTSGTWDSYDVTFKCAVDLKDVKLEKALALDNEGKVSNLTNVSICETHDYYALWISAAGQTVTIDGGNITSNGRGIKIDEQYVSDTDNALVNLTVKNYNFNTAKKGAILVKSAQGANITLDNVDISNVTEDTEYAVWCDEDATQYANRITVTGGKMKVEGTTPVVDGVLINKDGVYELSSLAGLNWFAEKVKTGESFVGKTVTLTADIDLNNVEWVPIGGSDKYDNNFAGTFDGGEHTISNLKVNNSSYAGLFSTMCGGAIKNLTIDGANLNSNHFAGAIIAWMEQGGKDFIIENCHVKNAIIKLTPNGTEGAYDNGDKAGAIAGWMRHGVISKCTATDVEITAYRDLGGIVGYAFSTTVTDNTVNGAKLVVDQVTNNYGDKVANVGEIIGRREGTPTESGNNYSNVTIDTKTAKEGDFNKVVVGGDF